MSNNTPTLTDSETKRAPWMEGATVYKRFPHHVLVTLAKKVYIPTYNYKEIEYRNDDDYMCIDFLPFRDNDWVKDYNDNCITLDTMLQELRKYAEQDLSMTGKHSPRGIYLQHLIEACEGWSVDDTVIEDIC